MTAHWNESQFWKALNKSMQLHPVGAVLRRMELRHDEGWPDVLATLVAPARTVLCELKHVDARPAWRIAWRKAQLPWLLEYTRGGGFACVLVCAGSMTEVHGYIAQPTMAWVHRMQEPAPRADILWRTGGTLITLGCDVERTWQGIDPVPLSIAVRTLLIAASERWA